MAVKSLKRPLRDDGKLIFSGHESFACRYGWLPKLYEVVASDPDVFSDDERAIVALGLGKNMVRSIRFWGTAFGLLNSNGRMLESTKFARRLLDPLTGIDPYLEEAGSLWRLHWQITFHARLGAWTVLFSEIDDAEIARDRLIEMVMRRSNDAASQSTIIAHVDILLRTYDATRLTENVVIEDALGCPLQELNLLRSDTHAGTSTVKINRGAKRNLDLASFAFSIHDFWSETAPASKSLSLRSLMLDRRSPGTIFRLDEASLHERLDALCSKAKSLTLREDGVGGFDLVALGKAGTSQLEKLAW